MKGLWHRLKGHQQRVDYGFVNHYCGAYVFDVHVVCSCGDNWWREGFPEEVPQ